MRSGLVLTIGCLFLILAVSVPAWGALAPARRVDLSTEERRAAARLSTQAARAIIDGNYEEALEITSEGLAMAPDDPWLLYNRGIALAELGRIDEAVAAFDRAETGFPPDDLWARAVTAWRRAYALERVGRCELAELAWEDYQDLVRQADPASARMAERRARECREVAPVRGREERGGPAAPGTREERQPRRHPAPPTGYEPPME